MSDEIQIINEGAETVVAVTLLTKPDEGGGFDAAALAEVMHAATAKSTPADNDAVAIVDSAASNGLKKTLWSAIKATLKTYFDTIYTNTSAVATQISNAITALGLGDAATKNVGTANGVASLGSDGKIPSTQLPAIAIVDYLGTAANEAAMLALTGQKGDWAQRTDLGTMWFITGDDPTQLASWREMTYPTAPVSSVAGLTGSIASGDLRTAMGLGTADVPVFAGLTTQGVIGGGDPSGNWFGINATQWFFGRGFQNKFAIQGNRASTNYAPTPVAGSDILYCWCDSTNANIGSIDTALGRSAGGIVETNNGTLGQYREHLMRGHKMAPIAISALPTASSNTGWRYEVSDANSPSIGVAVSSGGSAACEVRSNGTAWIVTQVF